MVACAIVSSEALALERSMCFEATTREDVRAHDQHHVSRLGDERVWRHREFDLSR